MESVYVPKNLSSLTIFNGPLTNVPFSIEMLCCNDRMSMSFTLDLRTPAYGTCKKCDLNGNYRGSSTELGPLD
jgi:hypothetical protein